MMPSTGSARLYELLDSLVALRLEFADGAEGDEALRLLGQAKVEEVRATLDAAIRRVKRIISELERAMPSRSPL
jgi:hypothetical protein